MKRMNSRFLVGAAIAALIALAPTVGVAQTFEACRIPNVGAIYMINVAGAPAACLDASHVAFSWTEGGTPADGSITTVKLADGAVTSLKIADGTIGVADIATDGVGAAEIAADAVGTSEIAASGVGTAEIADGAVTAAKLAAGAAVRTVTPRQTGPVVITAGTSNSVFSYCNVGEILTGGGSANQLTPGVYILQTFPTSSGGAPGWGVSYYNTTVASANIYAYALCGS